MASNNGNGNAALDREVYERQSEICKAFAHPARLQILDLLAKGDRQAADLRDLLGISKPNLSQHIAILRSARIIATRREGKAVVCSLTMPEVKDACSLIRDVLRNQVRADRKLRM